jgi:hypothetical protein
VLSFDVRGPHPSLSRRHPSFLADHFSYQARGISMPCIAQGTVVRSQSERGWVAGAGVGVLAKFLPFSIVTLQMNEAFPALPWVYLTFRSRLN